MQRWALAQDNMVLERLLVDHFQIWFWRTNIESTWKQFTLLATCKNYNSDIHTICHGYNIHTALLTPPSTIYCHYSHSVVTELLQSCQCELPGSTSHSSHVGVIKSITRPLKGEGHLIAVHNIPLWLGPSEVDGCGGLGVNHSDGWGRGNWDWEMK